VRVNVGFIGLGRMGSGMAARLLERGHPLVVYDRVPERADALAAAGATVVRSVREASEGQDLVITMLTDDAALHEVAYGSGGLVESLQAGAIHAAMGTHGVLAIRTLDDAHARGHQTLVAAPVLGRPDFAAAGQLGIVAAGPEPAVSACTGLFAAIGRRTFTVGARPEAASAIKIANNFVLGCAIEAMGEAFALVRKHGVAPQQFYDVLTDGFFAAPAYKVYGQIIADEAYDRAGATARIGLKDADLALAAAEAAQVPLPSAGIWRSRLVDAIARGDGEKDWAVMAREQARASGLE
jgi:3-hydroxyisobutyrate dehydrogenase-like beta-hydroxyacid dehydrogenase